MMNEQQSDFNPEGMGRRKFLSALSTTVGAGLLVSNQQGLMGMSTAQTWTVGKLIDLFLQEVPGAPFVNTVDTLKAGSREQLITGIVTTMFPTIPVIQKTISLGANFIIVHEPSFYNHQDDTSWLTNDDVYRFKAELLKKHSIAIWRNHDYIHSLASDGVRAGVVDQLGWGDYYNNLPVITIPSTTVGSLINHIKSKLGVTALRYLGDLSQPCQRVVLMPGAAGGRRQIESLMREKPDVLICGEVSEWETPEYVRDAISKGHQLALIVIGHSASEEPGSQFMADWVRKKFRNLP